MVSIASTLVFVLVFPAAGDLGFSNVRDQLRGRLDIESSDIQLAPVVPDDFDYAVDPVFDHEAFNEALGDVSGIDPESVSTISIDQTEWKAESPNHTITVNTRKSFVFVLDQSGYSVEAASALADDALLATSRTLLAGFGVRTEQTTNFAIRNLKVTVKPFVKGGYVVGEYLEPYQKIVARKVFFERTVAGIPVEGDRLVVTFALDGSFRKIIGTWRRVDYGASYLASTLTQEQFIEAALDMLVHRGTAPDVDLPISLGTHYVPREIAPGVFALNLKGYAKVGLRGPHGSRKWGIYSFDI